MPDPICVFCQDSFRHGPHAGEGRYLKHYEMWLCSTCVLFNNDGVSDAHKELFEKHLELNGIELPKLNTNGRYPLF